MFVFTFPGQGSQSPGMGDAWVAEPSWSVVAEISDATDRNVAELLLHTDAAALTQTHNAQLATFAASLVALHALRRAGIEPALVAGHSLGEYTALVAAGVVSVADASRLVAARGDAMHTAAGMRPGTMAAVLGLDAEQVAQACAQYGGVWVANDNAPGQVVIAGDPDAVASAGEAARSRGARKIMALPVGGAFHTPLMAPASEALDSALHEVRWLEGICPVVANVDAAVHVSGSDPSSSWPDLLVRQLTSPVRWREVLLAIAHEGATTLVEVGPGGVLTGLAKRTVPDLARVAVADPSAAVDVVALARREGR